MGWRGVGGVVPLAVWAPVSEPGFSDFQVFRFSILEIVCFVKNMFGKYAGEISRNKS